MRNKPQRNAYHRFTVDRHLLEAAAQAADSPSASPGPICCSSAALLHDIGKGSPGDHTDAGVEIVERIATRMGFAGRGRRDARRTSSATTCSSPSSRPGATSTIPPRSEPSQRQSGDRQTLDLLAALTEADSLATGPAAWGPWKAGLVADLVYRAAAASSRVTSFPRRQWRCCPQSTGRLMSQIRDAGADGSPGRARREIRG